MEYKLAVHYAQERINSKDNNSGLLWGIYYYDNDEIVNVEWYSSQKERDLILDS